MPTSSTSLETRSPTVYLANINLRRVEQSIESEGGVRRSPGLGEERQSIQVPGGCVSCATIRRQTLLPRIPSSRRVPFESGRRAGTTRRGVAYEGWWKIAANHNLPVKDPTSVSGGHSIWENVSYEVHKQTFDVLLPRMFSGTRLQLDRNACSKRLLRDSHEEGATPGPPQDDEDEDQVGRELVASASAAVDKGAERTGSKHSRKA